MEVKVRELKNKDIKELEKILKEHVRDPETNKIIQKEIKDIKGYMEGGKDNEERVREYLVALNKEGIPTGCMAWSTPDKDMLNHFDLGPEDTSELLNAFVSSKVFRGSGVGRQIFEEVCKKVKKQGKQYLIVHSGPRYKDSWGFYDKVCDDSKGFIKDKYGKGRHAKTWIKYL